MDASAAIAHSLLRQAYARFDLRAGGRARRSVGQRTALGTPSSFSAPRARLATRLRNFATNRHGRRGLPGIEELEGRAELLSSILFLFGINQWGSVPLESIYPWV